MSLSRPRSSGIRSRSTSLLSTSDNKSLASCRKSCRRSSMPLKSLILPPSESEAIQQVVDLLLINHDVGTPFGINHRTVHQAGHFNSSLGFRYYIKQHTHQP